MPPLSRCVDMKLLCWQLVGLMQLQQLPSHCHHHTHGMGQPVLEAE